MTRPIFSCCCALAVAASLANTTPAWADKADRDQPVKLDADRVKVDDKNKVLVLEGRVTLTQGSLLIRGDKIVVAQDPDGFQKGVASGGADGLARIRQKRAGGSDYMEGEAERIEYDARTERARLFNRAYVKSSQGEARGQYIAYDGSSDSYVVSSGPDGTIAKPTPGRDNRVQVVIPPKGRPPAAAGEAPGASDAPKGR